MPYVITEPCIDVRDQACVTVCPVACIHFDVGKDRKLYIDPNECIDCGACEPMCPVRAIYSEYDLPYKWDRFTRIDALWYRDKDAARAMVDATPKGRLGVQEKEGCGMATLDERFQKGLEMRGRLAGGQGRIYKGAVPAAYDLAPDLYRISTESLYGSIWSRPGLELRYRALATLTVAAIQLTTQVRSHIRNALNVGITPEEIIEILMMVAFYGGIPAAYNALAVTKEVLEERGMHVTLPETFDPSLEPKTLYERGVAKHQELISDVFGYHPTEPTPVERALDVLMHEYLWGAVWTRPGLDMKSRIVCALAALVVRGQYDVSVRRMIEGALHFGLTRTEIMEIGMQLAFYVGVLPARAFMHIANTVFRSPEFSQAEPRG